MSEIFIQTFFLYFIVIDPLGNTPLFLSITQNMDTNKKIRIALSASIIASIILLFFALLGSSLLSYLNISYPAFTIGGGIILLIIAIEMLFDKRQQRKGEDLDLNSDNVSVFPLATPIIAGPAAITSVIVSVSDIGTNFTNQTIGMLSLVFVLFLTFIIGVSSAYLVSFYKFTGSNFFKWALIISFAVPAYIYAYSLTAFFENYGTAFTILKN